MYACGRDVRAHLTCTRANTLHPGWGDAGHLGRGAWRVAGGGSGREGLLERLVDAEHLVEPGDPEDTQDAVVRAHDPQPAGVVADELQAPDQDPEAGRVEERDVVEVDDEPGAPGSDLLVEDGAQLGRGVDVDFSGDRDDADVVLARRGHGQLHGRGSLCFLQVTSPTMCRDQGLP